MVACSKTTCRERRIGALLPGAQGKTPLSNPDLGTEMAPLGYLVRVVELVIHKASDDAGLADGLVAKKDLRSECCSRVNR